MLRRKQQPQPGTPGQTPSLFEKCTGFFCVTQYMGPTALRPIRKTKQWLSVTAGDSNPHSADQKHQSLNSVLYTVPYTKWGYWSWKVSPKVFSAFKDPSRKYHRSGLFQFVLIHRHFKKIRHLRSIFHLRLEDHYLRSYVGLIVNLCRY